MKIAILTTGSRGDIQPFVALARGLQRAGLEPVICTGRLYESFVTDHGIAFAPMNDELIRMADTDEGRAIIESGGGKLSLIKRIQPMIRQILDDCWAAAQGAQALIYHPKTLAGYHISEKLNIPVFIGLPLPLYTPTGAFPIPIAPQSISLGGGYNRLTYGMLRLVSAPYIGTVNAWRRDTLGLPARGRFASEMIQANGSPMPVLYGYSAHVVPVPADWPDSAHVTGYWFLEDGRDWQPPAELAAFLDSGPAPVYVGFGSMAGTRAEQTTQIVVDALARAKQRGIIATGWGGLKAVDAPKNILVIDQAPHDWLFPRMAALVHHGGAGTTGAGLRAGRPTIICPFFGDQPFWGARVYQSGAGPRPIAQKRLTADALASAITQAVSDRAMIESAAVLGERIRAEDGVARAVQIVQEYLDIRVGDSA